MAVKYRVEEKTGDYATLSDIEGWAKQGWHIVGCVAWGVEKPKPFKSVYYLAYQGGIEAHKAIRR